MAKLRRENHFLPKCYQNAFTDGCGRVWVLVPGERRPQSRNPETLGTRRNFYIRTRDAIEMDDVEKFLDKEVEAPFAALSKRIKREKNAISELSGNEAAALAKFIASQVLRTVAYRSCVEEQAGRSVDGSTFVSVMLRQMMVIVNGWINLPPTLDFYTSLPYVEERFITGDHPVLVVQVNDSSIWTPTDTPHLKIVKLGEILSSPKYAFILSLSPYVCVSLCGKGDGMPHLPPKTWEPPAVRLFNNLIRNQCELFTLARDAADLG